MTVWLENPEIDPFEGEWAALCVLCTTLSLPDNNTNGKARVECVLPECAPPAQADQQD
jgi:hypothetical protein